MNEKRRIVVGITLAAFLIAALYFLINADKNVRVDSGFRVVMGTFNRVVAIAPNSRIADKCIEAAFEQLELVDNLMSDYNDNSEIGIVNCQAFERPVKVSKPTYDVLQKALKFSRLSGGAFDVTIGPLMYLWRSASEANSIPTDFQLQQARSKIGFEKLILDSNDMTVRFAVVGMKLDLGGIAKGYAIDQTVLAMRRCGAVGGMVDVGGEIYVFGEPPSGKDHWLIGLQDPRTAQADLGTGKPLLILKLNDAAVSTSGDYQRFVLIEGKKYSHIIEPETGRSSAELTSVTIISPNAADADALSTAVTVMGVEKGIELIESIPQTEAIFISSPPEYKFTKTSGAEKYIEK